MHKSRSEAAAIGERFYFTGKPCKRGHIDVRRTDNGSCASCKSLTDAEWSKNNPEARAAIYARHHAANKEARNAKDRAWYADNKDARARYMGGRREKSAESRREYHKRKPEIQLACIARRRAVKARAHKPWDEDLMGLVEKEAHALARARTAATGVKWNVDHIVPLAGKTVCGLHNEVNLRVITAFENMTKSNRHWPDMP